MTVTLNEKVGSRRVARAPLEEALREAEAGVLAELSVVREALGHAVRTVATGDAAPGEQVAEQAGELHRRYDDVHERLLALIARQAPVAGDLRLATALLHVNDRLERMSAQCVNIVTLCRAFPAGESPSARQLECLSGMANWPTSRWPRQPECSPTGTSMGLGDLSNTIWASTSPTGVASI